VNAGARLADLATLGRVQSTHKVRVRTSGVDDTLGLYVKLLTYTPHMYTQTDRNT